jgi:hypothetical protein
VTHDNLSSTLSSLPVVTTIPLNGHYAGVSDESIRNLMKARPDIGQTRPSQCVQAAGRRFLMLRADSQKQHSGLTVSLGNNRPGSPNQLRTWPTARQCVCIRPRLSGDPSRLGSGLPNKYFLYPHPCEDFHARFCACTPRRTSGDPFGVHPSLSHPRRSISLISDCYKENYVLPKRLCRCGATYFIVYKQGC